MITIREMKTLTEGTNWLASCINTIKTLTEITSFCILTDHFRLVFLISIRSMKTLTEDTTWVTGCKSLKIGNINLIITLTDITLFCILTDHFRLFLITIREMKP
jgi:hypothetical protein